jgi:hypothetical protein
VTIGLMSASCLASNSSFASSDETPSRGSASLLLKEAGQKHRPHH